MIAFLMGAVAPADDAPSWRPLAVYAGLCAMYVGAGLLFLTAIGYFTGIH